MALKDLAVSGDVKMEHVCSLCRGKMKRMQTSSDVYMCEKCSHIEYMS